MIDTQAEIGRMAALYRPNREDTLRIPPNATDAEQAVLGGLLLVPESLWRVADLLAPEDFYRRDHQLIYSAIMELADKRKPFDAVTLGDWFHAQGLADHVDGGAYLIELASTTASAANIGAYAEIVRDKALQRRLIDVGTEIVNAGFDPAGEPDQSLATAQTLVQGLMPRQRGGLVPAADGLTDWYQDLQRRWEADGRVTGLPTPWADLNRATHGLQPGELTIVAARPSMGKSVFGLNVALFSAMREVRTAVFSLEMSRRQINRRNIASLRNIPHDWLLAPSQDGEDYFAQVTGAISELKQKQSWLYADDTPDLTINQLMARARNLHLREPIQLLVVDHIHDFKINAKEARFEYGRIAQGLKTLAKEFDCPVVALAQLNRALSARADKRPTLSDLRESGEIEQKADTVLFLHREDYYTPDTHMRGAVEVIIAKGRDIEAGKTIHLRNEYACMALRDWEGPMPQAPEPERGGSRFFPGRHRPARCLTGGDA